MLVKHEQLTEQIIKGFYIVYRALGYGFLEKVYENALVLELHQRGADVRQQVPITVCYRGGIVGEYVADLVVAGKVIVELKATSRIEPFHEVQLVNYLKATDIEVGLLVNFGHELKYVRRVLSNQE